jgi:Flp pilus assembly protein TadD
VAWLIGAEVRTRQGDTAGALARLDEAESRARTTGIDAVYNLEALRADALARSGRPREAEAAYRREIAAFPTHLVAHANLAALLYAQGRRDEGRATLESMLVSNPNPQARRVAVVTLEAVGERAGASRVAR